MRTKLEVGMSWSHVEVIGHTTDDRLLDFGNGIKETWKNQSKFKLRCTCGKEFDLWENEFKAKKFLRDCGCGAGLLEGVTTHFQVSCKMDLFKRIKGYAANRKLSVSRATVELLRKGLRGE